MRGPSRRTAIGTGLITEQCLIKLYFILDSIGNRIRNHIKRNNLPIKVVFSPARKLRNIVCNNRLMIKEPPID